MSLDRLFVPVQYAAPFKAARSAEELRARFVRFLGQQEGAALWAETVRMAAASPQPFLEFAAERLRRALVAIGRG